ARKSSCSLRTFDGPQPNRPSAGSRWAGISISGMRRFYGLPRLPQRSNSLGLGAGQELEEADMADLIDTTEMYLRTILELEEEGIVPLRARISERLGHSGPTVSQTVARMERDGLVVVSDDRHLELTEEGRAKSVRVMRKHRLAERLLADVIGLEWEYVHDEACRGEHVMSEQVERKLLTMLDNPVESPYGNPIPGLDELGARATMPFGSGVVNVMALFENGEEQARARIRRLAEPA